MPLPSSRKGGFGQSNVVSKVQLNFKGGLLYFVCSRISCFAKNWLFLLNFLFCKISWKFQFSVKWLHPKAKFKKGDPLKIQFYLTDTISQPNDTFSRAWQWHWFDFGLIFTFLLANWWFAARFSSCSSSLNFEAKINFYTTKENCRKCRAKCTGLKLDLGPFSGSQKRLLFNRISWWPCIYWCCRRLTCEFVQLPRLWKPIVNPMDHLQH